jgi:hypothetical protein
MSLIHRVTSIDGQDRDYHGGTVKSIRRVISYDAFHPTEEVPEDHAHSPLHTVTAYKVSTAKRVGRSPPTAAYRYRCFMLTYI